jgi:hypothetical protein
MRLFTITEYRDYVFSRGFFKAEFVFLASGKQGIFFSACFTKQFVANKQKEGVLSPSLV